MQALFVGEMAMVPAKYFVFAFLAMVIPNMVGNMINLGLLSGVNLNIYLLGLMGNTLR